MTAMDNYNTAAFNQKHPLNALFPEGHECHRGICFALCVEWILRHRAQKGEKSVLRVNSVGSPTSVLQASVTQRQYAFEYIHGEHGDVSGKTAQDIAMSYRGLKYKSGNWEKFVDYKDKNKFRSDLAELSGRVSHAHQYHVVSFKFKKAGSHAICCYKSGGKIFGAASHLYVFDPNFGEFCVPSGKIKEFYESLFDKYYNWIDGDGEHAPHEVYQFSVRGVDFA